MKPRKRNHPFIIFPALLSVVLAACSIAPGAQTPTIEIVQETVLVVVSPTPAPETITPTASPQPTGAVLTGTPLPPATVIPSATSTPFVAPSLTPLALLNVPIEGGDPGHQFYALLVYPLYQPAATTSLWFRVYAHEPVSSKTDGKNIDHVTFSIKYINPTDNSQTEVYFHEEKTAGYCAFGGGEPNCTIYDFASHNYTWDGPNGDKIKMKSGKYDIHIIATDVDGNDMFGDGIFYVQVP